jgi:hypothetical protein
VTEVSSPPLQRPVLWRCLLVGLLAGLAASVLVVPAAAGLQAAVGRTYDEQLGVGHLVQATVLTMLLGAVVFYCAARWTRRPVLVFAVLAGGFAVTYSVVVALQPPASGFALVVGPLHVIVAAAAIAAFTLSRGHV